MFLPAINESNLNQISLSVKIFTALKLVTIGSSHYFLKSENN